jgi:DNA-binding NarL/FixJ family response regulator
MPLTAISSNKNIKVFIADDSLVVREHLVTMLDELPRIVIVGQAENVAEAINGILELQPDVVILDIRMPGGSGIDVLQTIKQDEPAPVVIILTNYPYPAYRQKCLQAGADFFLDKSTEFDQMPELLFSVEVSTRFKEKQKIWTLNYMLETYRTLRPRMT